MTGCATPSALPAVYPRDLSLAAMAGGTGGGGIGGLWAGICASRAWTLGGGASSTSFCLVQDAARRRKTAVVVTESVTGCRMGEPPCLRQTRQRPARKPDGLTL